MTKLDLKNPVAGRYIMTRTVLHSRPDGRAARGWDSRTGTPVNTIVYVTVHPWRIDLPEADMVPEAARARVVEKAKQLRVFLGLPGRYHRPTEVAVDAFDWASERDDDDPQARASQRTLLEIVDALKLDVASGDGVLASIRQSPRYAWDEVLSFMVETGRVTAEQIRAAADAYDAKLDAEEE